MKIMVKPLTNEAGESMQFAPVPAETEAALAETEALPAETETSPAVYEDGIVTGDHLTVPAGTAPGGDISTVQVAGVGAAVNTLEVVPPGDADSTLYRIAADSANEMQGEACQAGGARMEEGNSELQPPTADGPADVKRGPTEDPGGGGCYVCGACCAAGAAQLVETRGCRSGRPLPELLADTVGHQLTVASDDLLCPLCLTLLQQCDRAGALATSAAGHLRNVASLRLGITCHAPRTPFKRKRGRPRKVDGGTTSAPRRRAGRPQVKEEDDLSWGESNGDVCLDWTAGVGVRVFGTYFPGQSSQPKLEHMTDLSTPSATKRSARIAIRRNAIITAAVHPVQRPHVLIDPRLRAEYLAAGAPKVRPYTHRMDPSERAPRRGRPRLPHLTGQQNSAEAGEDEAGLAGGAALGEGEVHQQPGSRTGGHAVAEAELGGGGYSDSRLQSTAQECSDDGASLRQYRTDPAQTDGGTSPPPGHAATDQPSADVPPDHLATHSSHPQPDPERQPDLLVPERRPDLIDLERQPDLIDLERQPDLIVPEQQPNRLDPERQPDLLVPEPDCDPRQPTPGCACVMCMDVTPRDGEGEPLPSGTEDQTEHKPHRPGKGQCEHCGRLVSGPLRLRRHQRICSSTVAGMKQKPVHECAECGQTFRTARLRHQHCQQEGHEPRACCPVCQRWFHPGFLRTHLLSHGGAFLCRVCGLHLSTQQSLRAHMNRHSGHKPYRCDQCAAAFRAASSLFMHRRYRHTDERPYPCTVCDNRYASRAALRVHLRNHTGERPFRCQLCDAAYTRRSGLTQHLRKHTQERKFACMTCGQRFDNKTAMQVHEDRHRGVRAYVCQRCRQAFFSGPNLQRHMQALCWRREFTAGQKLPPARRCQGAVVGAAGDGPGTEDSAEAVDSPDDVPTAELVLSIQRAPADLSVSV